jgi:uncharacterized protein
MTLSEYIDNRSSAKSNRAERQKVLKDIILQLHEGKDPADVKNEFAKLIDGVSASEISEMESGLVAEGMAIEEIQKLCDVHAEIFRGAVTQIHTTSKEEEKPGHPVRVLREENFAIESLLKNTLMPKVAALTDATVAEKRYETAGGCQSAPGYRQALQPQREYFLPLHGKVRHFGAAKGHVGRG